MSGERTFQHSRRPPDVEEALSSMLWTPYEPTSTESSSDEDDRCRINRLHKSHSSYDRRYAYEPLTTTGYEVENRFCSPAMMTVPTTTNVANSLQSTPFVPFTNYFYNNRNNTDSSDSPKISSNRKQRNSFKDGSLRFSYPYYGPIPSLNKWWAPSIGSKEPPSYDSLYLKESLKSKEVVAHTNDINSKSLNSDDFSTIKSAEFDERKTENYFNKPSPNESYSQPLGKLENIIRSTAASETCCDNAAHNRVDNNNDNTNQDHEVKENLLKNIRSQQTEECKNKMNKSNNNEQNDDDDDDEADSRRKKIQVKQHANNSQSNAMALSITAAITAETNNTTKEAERPKTTTLDGEEVSQPVSYIDSNENSLLSSDVRTRVVNNQKCKNNAFGRRLDTNSMNGVCSNNGMDAAGVSTLSNLFAELQSDKATSAKRACSRNWESNFTEIYAEPPVVDAVTIIQSVSRSFDGRLGACQSRSSLVALPSYSHLWEKTLNSVRSKVKRVTRSRFEIVPPSDALTPNKCLAELERLYAEFRASESALAAARKDADEDSRSIESRQHCFNRIQSDRGDSGSNCADECELLTANSSASVANPNSSLSMRLSVPAPTDGSFRSSAADLQTQQVQTSKVLPTSRTSSVFLGSPDYVAASCPPSNGRQRSISVSSDDRCSNLLHENKQNNGNCFNSEENEKIYIDDVVVGAIENAKGSNNNATEPVLASSATRHQASLTIHVNSDKSDQNNNSNCIYNKNNRSIYNLTNNCVNNSDNIAHIGVEAALQNVKVYVQQENIVKNNGVSVVNCNYSSAYQTNNAITITPVSSASVNRSGDSEVSVVPNNICKVKNITARSDSNGNEIEIGNFAENINVIGLNPPSTSALRGGPQQRANTSTTVSPTRSASTNELQSQANSVPRSATFPPVIVSDVSRTFTSTECQTDEIPAARLRSNRVPVSPVSNRVQRRRDRRERRQLQQQLSSSYPHPQHLHMPSVLRRPQDRHSMPPGPVSMSSIAALHLQSSIHHSATTPMQSAMSTLLRPMIPDLLHRHFPPPYSALPLNGCSTSVVTSSPPPTIVGPIPPPPPGTTLLTPVISTVPMPGVAPPVVSEGCFTLPLPIIRRSPSERSGKGCCGQWFAGPPLRALIAVVALGGIACALGGAALGATGLAGPPTSHLTAALLMIGVGVVLVTVSGAAWRMTAPGGPPCLGLGSAVDLGRCGRRPCGRGGGNAHGLLYPEFQHRPPPPSYQASMQEYRLRLLLLDRDRQNGVVRGNSPPPTYRSYTGSLLRAPLTTTSRNGGATGSIASEYSLPPSYRSRITTPATISSGRSVDIASSDRLLADKDSAEQCTTQKSPNSQNDSTNVSPPERPTVSTAEKSQGLQQRQNSRFHQVHTSAIVEIEATSSGVVQPNIKNVLEVNKVDETKATSSTAHRELVTIVTISKNDAQSDRDLPIGGEHIEILAHL